jgi:hypothetical protein
VCAAAAAVKGLAQLGVKINKIHKMNFYLFSLESANRAGFPRPVVMRANN